MVRCKDRIACPIHLLLVLSPFPHFFPFHAPNISPYRFYIIWAICLIRRTDAASSDDVKERVLKIFEERANTLYSIISLKNCLPFPYGPPSVSDRFYFGRLFIPWTPMLVAGANCLWYCCGQ